MNSFVLPQIIGKLKQWRAAARMRNHALHLSYVWPEQRGRNNKVFWDIAVIRGGHTSNQTQGPP